MGIYKDLNDYEIMYMISENDEDATNLLFTKYKPIILKLAKDYYKYAKNCGLELDDFIQEGYYALFCAMKNYTENKKSLFYTYAIICIRSKMKNLIVTNTTDRNKLLNESISIYDNIANTTKAIADVISDSKALNPYMEIENVEFYNDIKNIIYHITNNK